MIDQINELPEDGLKSSPKTSRYTENKWISRKNQNELYFLHLIDILNDLLLIFLMSYLYRKYLNNKSQSASSTMEEIVIHSISMNYTKNQKMIKYEPQLLYLDWNNFYSKQIAASNIFNIFFRLCVKYFLNLNSFFN